jgi:hypothetical protein
MCRGTAPLGVRKGACASWVFAVLLVAIGPIQTLAATAAPAIPDLSAWESNMLSFGATHCNKLQDGSLDINVRLNETYYDSERVFYQIYHYTKDSRWLSCAQSAETVYRDGYVMANKGTVPGYWTFPHGIWYDWKRTGDSVSQNALLMLANSAGFAYAPLAWTARTDASREVAYNMTTKLLALDAGYADQARLNDLITQAFDHMNQWFVMKNAPYVRPFMVALTAEALITYHRKTNDTRVLPAVKMAVDYLWNCCWIPSANAMAYTDRVAADGSGDMSPAPDLNLLIAPAFAWVYYMTGDATYQQRGDSIFSGGVVAGPSFVQFGKQFNQNYRWSFDFVYWRRNQLSQLYAAIATDGTPIPASTRQGGAGGFSPGGSPVSQGQPRNVRKR